MNPKCLRNPGKDYSGRRSPVYVSRVLSAMVNQTPRIGFYFSLCSHFFCCCKNSQVLGFFFVLACATSDFKKLIFSPALDQL